MALTSECRTRRSKLPEKPVVMHMIVPGRRALGEDWSKVTVYANPDTGGYDVEREDTPAPAEGCAIFVPAMGNLSYEAVDYLLEYKRKDQEYRKSHNMPIKRGWSEKEISQLFQDWIQLKLKRFKHQTFSGPNSWAQRD